MVKPKFKKGDRVMGTGRHDEVDLTGRVGTVKKVKIHSSMPYAVEWDKKSDHFWACGGACKDGYGFNCTEAVLKLAVITDWQAHIEGLR